MIFTSPITDEDIEDYLADRLDADRRSAVEAWLRDNPEAEAEVRAMREHQDALRAIGDAILQEPLPDRFLALLEDEDSATAVSSEDGEAVEQDDVAGCGAGR